MARQSLKPQGVADLPIPLSSVIVSSGDGDLVYLAGQGPFDADGKLVEGDFRTEARQTFENVRLCLAAAGCGFGDVLKVQTFLADLADFQVYNEVYREYFSEPYPVRTTVQAGLLGFRIEVDCVARRP